MQKELKTAQSSLTEGKIRDFWQKMTQKHQDMCVNGGIRIDFDRNFTQAIFDDILEQLLKCAHSGLVVATPLFEYNYDPDNSIPHHVASLTLFYDRNNSNIILNYFNPKGKSSPRLQKEKRLMTALGQMIKQRTGKPVFTYMFYGKNMQIDDNIGLCQLYSLYYLYNFIKNPQPQSPSYFIRSIELQDGTFNEKQLYDFTRNIFELN